MKTTQFATLLLVMVSALQARGASTIEADYRTKVLRDLNSSQIVQSNIKNKIRSSCPGAKSPDLSSCFKAQLQPVEIKSTSHLMFLTGVAMMAANMDQESGHSAATASLLAADNLLAIFEKIDLRHFHLNQITINGVDDYLQVVTLRREENQMLDAARIKVFAAVERAIQDAGTAMRTPASVTPEMQVWQTNQVRLLSNRLQTVKSKSLQFSNTETTYDRGEIFRYHMREQQKSICYNPHTTACKQLSLNACIKIARTAYSSCDSKGAAAREPAQFSSGTDVASYLRILNQCAAPLVKQLLIKKAPTCH